MSTPKHRLMAETHARRIYAIVRRSDGRVLETFCTRSGAILYRGEQVKAGHWKARSTRIVAGWFTPGAARQVVLVSRQVVGAPNDV